VKSKKVSVIIIIALIVIIACVIGILKLLDRNSYGLKKYGTLYDNISDFYVLSEENPNQLTQSYLECITYQITNIDKKEMIVTIEIQMPQISDELSNTLDKVVSENKDIKYDDLKKIAKKVFADTLKSEKLNKNAETFTLPIEKIDGSYKIIPSQEWNMLLTENLEKLYKEYFKTLIGGMTDEMPQ
jgi:flagellar basal body-associated protein FliL